MPADVARVRGYKVSDRSRDVGRVVDPAPTAAAKQATPEERQRASAVTATSWLYDPADVARTLVLLASDEAATITGASIAIDHATTAGGWASQWVHQMIARPSGTG